MTRNQKWIGGTIAFVALGVVMIIAIVRQEPNADLKRSASDRREFATKFRHDTGRLGTVTEGSRDEGLVVSDCTDETILKMVADREMRDTLGRYNYAWIRCTDGKPVSGKGIWWRE